MNSKLIEKNYPEFPKKSVKMSFLNLFQVTTKNQEDSTNTKVWGILTQKQKSKIAESFKKRVKHTSKKVKKDIISIVMLRDSLNGKRKLYIDSISSLIIKQSQNSGLGFEFFARDALDRNNKNDKISFYKAGQDLDQNYCTDLIGSFIDNNGIKQNIGIDFTFSKNPTIKRRKLGKAKTTNNTLQMYGIKDYSRVRAPTKVGVLFIERDLISAGGRVFSNALSKFYNSKNYIGGPSKYLPAKLQNSINNFSEILIYIFEKLKNNEIGKFVYKGYSINIKQEKGKLNISVYNNQILLFEFIL